ncbi:MAG: amidase [Planctomycetota bacterium]|jgi:Asp-tRNA(Asn)/Glu-tRNA(Gln) amidotransferase A subunit family amidase
MLTLSRLPLAVALLAITSAACKQQQPFVIEEASIAEIHSAMGRGGVSSQELVAFYLDRIESYDRALDLNAIVVTNPAAMQRAKELDSEFEDSGKLRPLHGIPLIIKDNYDTGDLPTTAGSIALESSIPPDDSFQVRRLREAGAIVLAKSSMAEWAFSPYETVSSVTGVTRNPYDLERVPAGSSGGTGAAVSANFGVAGLGTDTGNSIRGPSSHAALVGIRPTLGLTSRDGIVPLYLRNDIGGPMARSVEDVSRILQVIAGSDPADPITELSDGKVPASYLEYLDPKGLTGARIGVLRSLVQPEEIHPEVLALFETAIRDLSLQGAVIIDPIEIPDLKRDSNRLWKNTFRHDVEAYFSSLGEEAPVTSLADVLAGGLFHSSVEGRIRNALRSQTETDATVYSADPADDPGRARLRERVLAIMSEHDLQALIYPSWNYPPRPIGDLESPHGNNSPFIPPHTGQPAITVPMGFTSSGLPTGLQILGWPFGEGDLLRFAYAYEQATAHRQPPELPDPGSR